jgi:DNA repair exonuclease SbcCD ATPase subunit
MAIASVVQGLIETEDGKVFELDSCKGSAWLELIGSFRYEPTGANKPYTVRQETKKGGDYWYGYRKVAGKLHKKYIGKSSELSTAKLEEIAEALNTPQQPRVTQATDTVTQVTDTVTQVTDTVTQVAETSNQQVTDAVTDSHTVERVTALELQMQALRESLEALRNELLGKPEGLGNFSELPNPYEVTDNELQIELGNLKTELSNLATENEKIRADYVALLESSTVVTNKLRQEVQELRSQLEQERADREEVEAELADLKQNSTTASELPEPEHIEFLKRLVAKKDPLIASDLWQEIERLKESHRRLRLKMGAERRESIEKTSDLDDWVKGLTRRVEEKQARLDELEAQLEQERADREEVEAELADLKQNQPLPASYQKRPTCSTN